jgi:cobalt-zinc-cadmium efflux system outer membrane protein
VALLQLVTFASLVVRTVTLGAGDEPVVPGQPANQPPPVAGQLLPTPANAVPDPRLGWEASGPVRPDMALPTEAPAPLAWTLVDLQQLAQQHNPALVQARLAVRTAAGQQVQAGLYLNPEVGWYAGDMGLEQTSGQQGAFIAQEFITARKRQLAAATAGHGVTAARYALDAQHWRVMNEVRNNFYEVLIAQRTVEIKQQLLQVARNAQDITARSRALQEVTEADVLQASIEAEQADISLFQARNRYGAAWFQLVTVVGRPDLHCAPLTGDVVDDLPEVRWDEGLQRLLSLSPELAQARARLEQARCNLAWQQALGRPNVALQVGVKYDEAVRDTLTDAQFSLPLQLFDRNQGNILAARAELASAGQEVDRVELDLRNRFVAAFEQYSNSRYEVDVYRTSLLDKARRSLELIAIGYREGEFSYLSLLTAQRTFFDANLEYLASLQRLWAQAIALDGFLLGNAAAE